MARKAKTVTITQKAHEALIEVLAASIDVFDESDDEAGDIVTRLHELRRATVKASECDLDALTENGTEG